MIMGEVVSRVKIAQVVCAILCRIAKKDFPTVLIDRLEGEIVDNALQVAPRAS